MHYSGLMSGEAVELPGVALETIILGNLKSCLINYTRLSPQTHEHIYLQKMTQQLETPLPLFSIITAFHAIF